MSSSETYSSESSYEPEPYIEPTLEEIIIADNQAQRAITTEYKSFDIESGTSFLRDGCSVRVNFQPSVQYKNSIVEITGFYCSGQRGMGKGAKLLRDVLVYLKTIYPELSHCILTPVPSIPTAKLKEIKEKYSEKDVLLQIENVRSALTNNLIKYYRKIGFNEDVPNMPDYLLGSIFNIVNKIDSMGSGFKKTKTNVKINKKTRKQKQTKKKNKHIFQ